MKWLLIITLAMVTACSNAPRPDLGSKKVGGKTYVAYDQKVAGVRVTTSWKEQPSQVQKLKDVLQKPAEWTLYVCLPLAIVMLAASAFVSMPALSRKLAIGAGIAGTSAVIASAWLLATMYMLLFIILIIGLCFLVYKKTKYKGLTWNKGGNDVR